MPVLHSTPACAFSSSPGQKHCTAGPHRRLVVQQDFSSQSLHHLTRQSGSRTLLPLRAHRNGRESSTRFPITGDGRPNADRHASRPSSAPFGSQPVAADLATRKFKARASSEGEVRRPSYDGPRTPLQRQRPGPQRPMDTRQQQQSQGPAYAPSGSSNAQQRPQSYPQQSTTLQRPQRPGQQQQQSVQQRQPEPPARGGFGRQHAVVHFCLQYHTNYGQRIRLVGSHDNLGAWQLRDGVDMRWTDGDNWVADVELPGSCVYEYKYVLLDAHSGQALSWQRGNNSVLALRAGEDRVEVFDNWEGQPGAAVVSAGGSATRERRLLDWANEMEALVSTQRNDLRRSRMELVAATEDATAARAELRSARAELARTRAQQAMERRKAAELAAQNAALQRHLAETTSSFREALQLVESLLGEDTQSSDEDESDSDDSGAESAAGRGSAGDGSGDGRGLEAPSPILAAASNGMSSSREAPGTASSRAAPQAEQMQFTG